MSCGAPASARTAGAPTATSEAILPLASTRTADGVPLAPKARPTAKPSSSTGVHSTCQAAKFGEFRGKTFAEVEQAIGRAADQVEGQVAGLKPGELPPGAVRITWRLADGSLIHVDVPGAGNTSPFLINRAPHVARISPEGYHLTDAGVGVPQASTPAHIEIEPDARLREVITGRGGQ